jgi:hypothetical protein
LELALLKISLLCKGFPTEGGLTVIYNVQHKTMSKKKSREVSPKQKSFPNEPERRIPNKPDPNPDPSKKPEKNDPTRIEDPPKTDPTKIDEPDPDPSKPPKK